jgi:hypothetical protein
MPTTPIKKKSLSKKQIIYIAIAGVVILGLVITFLIKGNAGNQKNYSKLNINNIPTQNKITTDFTLDNDLKIKVPDDNSLFLNGNTISSSGLRNSAFRLELTQENSNVTTGIYAFSKTQNLNSNSLILDTKKGTLTLFHDKGIDVTNKTQNDYYKAVSDYFSLGSMEIESINKIGTSNGDTYTYKVSYQGKPVFFEGSSREAAIITVRNNTVTDVFLHVIPSGQFAKDRELKPITLVNNKIFRDLNYSASAEPDAIRSTSEYGSEAVDSNFYNVKLTGYKDCYYYYFEQSGEKTMLLPAVEVNNDYVARDFSKGKLNLIIINQDPVFARQL